jgi:hypothetical protein
MCANINPDLVFMNMRYKPGYQIRFGAAQDRGRIIVERCVDNPAPEKSIQDAVRSDSSREHTADEFLRFLIHFPIASS